MLKYGKISEVDYAKGFARVDFDEINIVSGWLSLPTFSTKGTKHFIPLEINTQVAVLMHPDGEQGEIIKAIWSTEDLPPAWADENTQGVQFSDGTKITYNQSTHKLIVELCNGGSAEINAKNEVVDAIMGVLNGAPVTEPGNGSPSALQAALSSAIAGKNQGKWVK
jgi:phage baseplate assembly protein V